MKTKLGTLLLLSLILLLLVSACGPTTLQSKLVGSWRFSTMDNYTLEFHSDSSFVITELDDKHQATGIANQGAYVVDDTKDPARIDIDGMLGRAFGGFVGENGVIKGIIRFRNDNVVEIAVGGTSSVKTGYPTSFGDGSATIIIYRIQK